MARRAMAEMPAAATAAPPLPAAASGIDISSANAEPNWAALSQAGDTFVGIKATEGDYYVNEPSQPKNPGPGYAAEATAATAAGLYVMPYAFANPYQGDGTSAHTSNGSGTCQADYAWQEISSVTSPAYTSSTLMLPVVLDMEQDPYVATEGTNANECYGLSPSDMVTWIGQFLTEMKTLSGKTPIIYTDTDFWSTCTGKSTAFASYPLWLAAPGVPSPPAVAGWSTPTLWQYSASGNVAGVNPVDLDYLTPLAQTSKVGTAVTSVQVQSLSSLNGQSVTYTATGLPPGLSISSSGLITGTPTAAGSYAVSVKPSAGPSLSFTWDVTGTITVSPVSSQTTTAGSPQALTVKATDTNAGASGYTPPKFTATGLPSGLSINSSSGLISGWPAAAGTSSVKVTATDGLGATASASFTWTVKAVADVGVTGTVRQHSGSNKCLDDLSSHTANYSPIDLATCTGASNQAWTAAQDGTIRVLGHCLLASGIKVLLYTCNNSASEQWLAGTYGSLVNAASGTCLNGPSGAVANGTRPTMATCQNSASKVNQHWTRPAAPVVSGIGVKCLGLSGSTAVLVNCANSTAQDWTPEPAGTFALQSNGWCLAEHTSAGSTFAIDPCSNTTPTQQWTLAAAGRVAVELKNPATGLCITVPAGGTTGTKLVLGTCSTALNSTWRVG